jgi:hypothetical protein
MRRLALCLAIVVGALVAASAARADGPTFVTQFGQGVTHGAVRYVPVSVYPANRTDLVTISTVDGSAGQALQLPGQWGLPAIGSGAEGLSRDGRTLVLGQVAIGVTSPSKFLIVNPVRMKIVRTIVLRGYFSFDALSPNASRMYLIQYTHGKSQDLTHYIVRGYDLRTNRLLPGKIADRSEDEGTMAGYALTRTTSAGGRWVYTLYQKPNGGAFVHALDTVAAAAYCIDLPKNRGLYNIVLSMRNGGRTLAVHWRSGRPWLNVAVGTWRISYPRAGIPWTWVGAGIGGGLGLLAAGALFLRRRRGQELQEHARQQLGLA